jgi:nucleoid-associated protein YgaU
MTEQPIPMGSALRAIRQAAESSGLEPVAELYNEAVRYAQEGHLKQARERIQVVLALSPEDVEARLFLAKIAVGGQRWRDALAALDAVESHGGQVPRELRRAVEDSIRAEQASDDEQRQARSAAQQGEVKALRQEARRLRSENAQLMGQITELEAENQRWTYITAGVSGLAVMFMLGSLLLGGGSEAAPAEDIVVAGSTPGTVAEAPVVAVPTPEVVAEVAAPEVAPTPSPTSLTDAAAEALRVAPGLDGTSLEVTVGGGEAMLAGTVKTFRQLKQAEQALLAVSGITSVQTSPVLIKARTEGTVHVVQRGDNLSKLAYEYYGASSETKPILKANSKVLGGRANLQIDMVLRIPAID